VTAPAKIVEVLGGPRATALSAPFPRLATLLLAATAATAAVELALRLLVLSPSPTVTDPVLGRLLKPNTHYRQSAEGFSSFTTNALGFNDAPIPAGEKNAILVLGDSYIEAQQVDPADNFLAYFRRQNPDRAIIAAGRAGLSPLSYDDLARYVARRAGFQQIVVVLNSSDVKDILESDVQVQRGPDGKIVSLANREQQRPEGIEADAFRFLVSRSSIFALINEKFIETLKANAAAFREGIRTLRRHLASATATSAADQAAGSGSTAATPKGLPDVVDVTEFLLSELKRQAAVEVVYVPLLVYRSGRTVDEQADSAAARRAFTCAAARSMTPMVALNEPLTRVFQETGEPPNGFSNIGLGLGHLNALGHQVLARAIADVVDHPSVPQSGC